MEWKDLDWGEAVLIINVQNFRWSTFRIPLAGESMDNRPLLHLSLHLPLFFTFLEK
jgi:hypothetical protein